MKNTIKGVESGVDDPEKLRKLSEELLKQREDLAAKDKCRLQFYNGYRDRECDAINDYRDAHNAFLDGNYELGEKLIKSAQRAEADADHLYRQFLNV